MGKRILKSLTTNIGFKILALFVALILWIVVYSTTDSDQTTTYTVSITEENKDTLTDDLGKVGTATDLGEVKVRVSGKRSYIRMLSSSDVKVTADYSNISIKEDGTAEIPLDVSFSRFQSYLKVVSMSQEYLHLENVESYVSDSFLVTPATTGKTADGYAVGETKVNSSTYLKVGGPQSLIDEIDTVQATVDIQDATGSFTGNATLEFYDADGKEIDKTQLDYDATNVLVYVEILNTKSVPIKLATSGTPPDGVTITDVSCDVDEITIMGEASALNPITAIEVPASVLDVSKISETSTTTVDISEYLPEGVELVDKNQAIITVTITVETNTTKQFKVSTDSISVTGLGDDYELTFDDATITVSVSGEKSTLDSLTASMLTGTIDVSGMGAGTHTATITFDLAGSYEIGSVTVSFTIKEKTSSTDDGTNGDDTKNGTSR